MKKQILFAILASTFSASVFAGCCTLIYKSAGKPPKIFSSSNIEACIDAHKKDTSFRYEYDDKACPKK